MNLRLLCFCSIMLLCCRRAYKREYYWAGSRNGQPITDTVFFCQNRFEKGDSIIIACNTGGRFSDTFIFSKSDKRKGFYSGRPESKVDLWFEGRMIKERSKTVFTFEADTVVEVNQVKFLVCKYHYDEEQTEDAGCNYYWVTGIGMVCFSSTAWDITYRLFTNDSETDKAIAGIVGSIQNWKKKLK